METIKALQLSKYAEKEQYVPSMLSTVKLILSFG